MYFQYFLLISGSKRKIHYNTLKINTSKDECFSFDVKILGLFVCTRLSIVKILNYAFAPDEEIVFSIDRD